LTDDDVSDMRKEIEKLFGEEKFSDESWKLN
jgi:hypothetical protein